MHEILYTCVIKNMLDLKPYDCNIRRLDINHLCEVDHLQKNVVENLVDKDMYVSSTVEEFKEVLSEKGITLGAFVGDKLIGFSSTYFPGNREQNIGGCVGVSGKALLEVAQLETAVIHMSYRGNSLQKLLTTLCVNLALERGNWRHLCATVAPGNYPSIQTTFSVNLVIKALEYKYDNRMRYILYQDIVNPIKMESTSCIAVLSTDLDTQRRLLAERYYGFSLEKKEKEINILFGKSKQS